MVEYDKQFEIAINLVSKVVPVSVEMPNMRVITPKYYLDNFLDEELKEANFGEDAVPIATYRQDIDNTIFLVRRRKESRDWSEKDVVYYLCHEFGHVLQLAINPSLNMNSVDDNMHNVDKRVRELAKCYLAFIEGSAEFIAVTACYGSDDSAIRESGKRNHEFRKKQLAFALKRVFRGNSSNLDLSVDSNEWRLPLISILNRTNGMAVDNNPYEFGYHFMTEHNTKDLVAMIKEPPIYYSELLIPANYNP